VDEVAFQPGLETGEVHQARREHGRVALQGKGHVDDESPRNGTHQQQDEQRRRQRAHAAPRVEQRDARRERPDEGERLEEPREVHLAQQQGAGQRHERERAEQRDPAVVGAAAERAQLAAAAPDHPRRHRRHQQPVAVLRDVYPLPAELDQRGQERRQEQDGQEHGGGPVACATEEETLRTCVHGLFRISDTGSGPSA
jgi:hypothetical protein